MSNPEDSMYRGKRLGNMTREELIAIINEMGNDLHETRQLYIQQIQTLMRKK